MYTCPGPHQIGEKLQKEGQQQQADMHTVDIGIRGHNDIVVPQFFQPVFNIQSSLQ